jgi:hypothetical protein
MLAVPYFYRQYLPGVRKLCDVTDRSWEEDVRSIESMVDRRDVLTWTEEGGRDVWDVDGRDVKFTSAEVRDRILELFADSVRTDGEYVLLCEIIGRKWIKPIDDRVRERILHNIIQPFVWRNGLDTVDLVFKYRHNLNISFQHAAKEVILSIRKYNM